VKTATLQKGSHVEIDGLTVIYRGREEIMAVRELTVEVVPGEFLCVLGTTGCGKSTILNVIGGFIKPTHGRVAIDGDKVESPGPKCGVVFQEFALFPWLTVLGNVRFGPRSMGVGRSKAKTISLSHLEMVGLHEFCSLYPKELSGGMQQRVALARALANDPPLLLMDEPFGALDAQTRAEMQELLLRIWSGLGKTVIFVTHDIDEAIFLGDRIIVLTARPGQVKAEIPVRLPRPRSYDIVTSQTYVEIKRKVLELIREEASASQEPSI
jgi:NitT/TauT family transport system ATP-binding protein